MRFLIEFRSGPSPTPKIWLIRGQAATVGRTAEADYTVAGDHQMSRVHFRLEFRASGCYVRDLDSTNGTQVNGQKIGEALLHHGDSICAGQTEFTVHIHSERAADVPGAVPLPEFVAMTCASGIVSYQGCGPQPTALDVARKLGEVLPPHLIVNYMVLDRTPPPKPVYLLNWLSPAVAPQLSPVVLSPPVSVDSWDLFEQAWRKDALVCAYSRMDPVALLERLRCAARGQHQPGGLPLPEHMLGAWRPSQVARVLTTGVPAFARFVFEAIEAIFFEPQSSEHWELLADKTFADTLHQMGLTVRPSKPEKPSLRG